MRLHPLSLLLLCLVLTGAVALETSRPAHAKKPSEDPTALVQARRRFKEGVRFFETKQYAKARVAFMQAYVLKEHPTVLLNLAQSELRCGYEADAARHFAQFLRETDESNPAEVKLAEEGLEKSKQEVAEVVLAVDVDDAFILVDGVLQGRSPLPAPLYLTPGTHNIGVRKEGTSVTRQVTAIAGQSSTERINLTAAPPTAVERQPAKVKRKKKRVVKDKPDRAEAGREPFFRWLGHSPVGLIGSGVAVLGIGVGTVFAISWQSNVNAAEKTSDNILEAARVDGYDAPCATQPTEGYRTACADYVAFRDTADNHRNIALISGSVALVGIGTTIIAYFVSAEPDAEHGKRSAPPRVSVLPSVTPEQTSLNVVGRF
jgi:hypothetical protein